MSNIALQTVHIMSHSSGLQLYQGKTPRDIEVYPKTLEGRTALAAAIKGGTYPNPITVSNGAIIPANTVPPLTMPSAPVTTYPAFLAHIQAENATGAGTYEGAPADENVRGVISSTSGYMTFTVNNTLGANLSGFKLVHRYQTNLEAGGVGAWRVNGGDWHEFTMTGNTGTKKNQILSTDFSLNSGSNTIDLKWVSGTVYAEDWIEITREAVS